MLIVIHEGCDEYPLIRIQGLCLFVDRLRAFVQRIAHLNGRRLVERIANAAVHIIDLPRSVLGRLGLLVQARSKASSNSDTCSSGGTSNGGNDDGVDRVTVIDRDGRDQSGLERALTNDGVGTRLKRANTQVTVVVDGHHHGVLAGLSAEEVEGVEGRLDIEDHAGNNNLGLVVLDESALTNVVDLDSSNAVLLLRFQASKNGSEGHSARSNIRVIKSQVVVQGQSSSDVARKSKVDGSRVVVQSQSGRSVDGNDVDGNSPSIRRSVFVATVLELVGNRLEAVESNVGRRSVTEQP